MLVPTLALLTTFPAPQVPQLERELLSAPLFVAAVSSGDFDSDGVQDLVSFQPGFNDVPPRLFIHWGSGAGEFERGLEVPLDFVPRTKFFVEDLDGILGDDLILTEESGQEVAVLLSNGSRELESPTGLLMLPTDASLLHLTDLDGDGDQDLIASRSSAAGPSFLVFDRQGPMVFAPAATFIPSLGFNARLQLIDAEGDGDQDAVIIGSQGSGEALYQYSNAGSLPFVSIGLVETNQSYELGEASDIDGDGDEDLVLTAGTFPNRTVAVLRSQAGLLQPRESIVSINIGAVDIEVRDATGTGTRDLLLTDQEGAVFLLLDQGGGTYATTSELVPRARRAEEAFFADVTGDGIDDLVRCGLIRFDPSNCGIVLVNEGQQLPGTPISFGPAAPVEWPLCSPESLTSTDLNGDGWTDLAVASSGGSNLAIFENDRQGGWLPARSLLVDELGPYDVVHGDLDGDGDEDLVLDAADQLSWFENFSSGGSWQRHLILNAGGREGTSTLVRDFDRDGDPDLIRASRKVSGAPQARVEFFENDGTGTFAGAVSLLSVPDPQRIMALQLVDLTGDGLEDLAFGNNATSRPAVSWARRLGATSFAAPVELDSYTSSFGSSLGYNNMVHGDLDDDGDIDLVATSTAPPSRLTSFLNDGSGTFTLVTVDGASGAGGPFTLDIADMTGDGREDLLVAIRSDAFDSTLGIYPGLPGGGFGSLIGTMSEPGSALGLTTGDFDRDGDIDAASVFSALDTVAAYKNDLNRVISSSYCGPAVLNSTGEAAQTLVTGSPVVTNNRAVLAAYQLPAQSTGIFLVSRSDGFFASVPNSVGALCLSGAIGRYVGAGQVQTSGSAGAFSLPIDLLAIPQPTGFIAALAGESWFFQAWYRDSTGGIPTSNFTDGASTSWR